MFKDSDGISCSSPQRQLRPIMVADLTVATEFTEWSGSSTARCCGMLWFRSFATNDLELTATASISLNGVRSELRC